MVLGSDLGVPMSCGNRPCGLGGDSRQAHGACLMHMELGRCGDLEA